MLKIFSSYFKIQKSNIIDDIFITKSNRIFSNYYYVQLMKFQIRGETEFLYFYIGININETIKVNL